MILLCEDSVVASAKSEGRTREVEVRAEDCASVAAEFRVSSAQNCVDVPCFEDVGAVAGAD